MCKGEGAGLDRRACAFRPGALASPLVFARLLLALHLALGLLRKARGHTAFLRVGCRPEACAAAGNALGPGAQALAHAACARAFGSSRGWAHRRWFGRGRSGHQRCGEETRGQRPAKHEASLRRLCRSARANGVHVGESALCPRLTPTQRSRALRRRGPGVRPPTHTFPLGRELSILLK
jgi:hypothetical protein